MPRKQQGKSKQNKTMPCKTRLSRQGCASTGRAVQGRVRLARRENASQGLARPDTQPLKKHKSIGFFCKVCLEFR